MSSEEKKRGRGRQKGERERKRKEGDRCIGQAESILAVIGDYDEKPMPLNYIKLVERAEILMEVKNDLQSRLEELI